MKTICALLLLSTVTAQAGMAPRSTDSSAEGCMKIVVALRALNGSSMGVTAIATKPSTFTFNGVKKCTNAIACSYSWLKRNMKPGVNAMEMNAVAGSCGVGITSYLDLT